MSMAISVDFKRKISLCSILSLLVLTIYWQSQYHGFIAYDDALYITENQSIKTALNYNTLIWSFRDISAGYWHPLTWLSHILDWQLFGYNAGGHHWTNVILHIGNTLLLFLLLNRMTNKSIKSAFVAALFAVHPLNVESVEWIAERKNLLAMFFWLLTMWAYILYAERRSFTRYIPVILLYAFGLMTKPIVVVLPFVLLLLDYWPLKRFQGKGPTSLYIEKLPLFILSLIFSVLTILAASSIAAMPDLEAIPISLRLLNAVYSYAKYIGKMLWPQDLTVFYPYPDGFTLWQILGAGLLLSVVSLAAYKLKKGHPYVVVGWFWFLGTLLPVIGLTQAGEQALADRYAYWSLIGLFIMVSWGLPDLLSRWAYRKLFFISAVSIVIPSLMIVSSIQASRWKDSISLFSHSLSVTQGNYVAHNNLGTALMDGGEITEAKVHFIEVLKLRPKHFTARSNLGVILIYQGKLEEAIEQFSEALRLKPDFVKAYSNLGIALAKLGKPDIAMKYFEEAISIKPDYADAHNNLGFLMAGQGKLGEAITHFREALRIQPDHRNALNNLKLFLADQEDNRGP